MIHDQSTGNHLWLAARGPVAGDAGKRCPARRGGVRVLASPTANQFRLLISDFAIVACEGGGDAPCGRKQAGLERQA